MNPEISEKKLEELLKELGKEAKPSDVFEKKLLKAVKEKFKENNGYNQTGLFRFFRFKLQFAGILTILALTTTTIYAYNSDFIAQGHLLYPLKRSAERVEGLFAKNEEEKSNFYSKMAERRTRELNYIDRESKNFERTLNESERMLELAKVELTILEKKRPINKYQLNNFELKLPESTKPDIKIPENPETVTERNRVKVEENNTKENTINQDIQRKPTESNKEEVVKTEKLSEPKELPKSFAEREIPLTSEIFSDDKKIITRPITSEEKITAKTAPSIQLSPDTEALKKRIEKVEAELELLKPIDRNPETLKKRPQDEASNKIENSKRIKVLQKNL